MIGASDPPLAAEQPGPEPAIAVAGIALVDSVIVVVVWEPLATWRARLSGWQETSYRKLAEQAAEAQARTATRLEQAVAELRGPRDQLGSDSRRGAGGGDHR